MVIQFGDWKNTQHLANNNNNNNNNILAKMEREGSEDWQTLSTCKMWIQRSQNIWSGTLAIILKVFVSKKCPAAQMTKRLIYQPVISSCC